MMEHTLDVKNEEDDSNVAESVAIESLAYTSKM